MMVDANIANLPADQCRPILDQLNDRFLPELDDGAARSRFMEIIDESVNAMFAEVMEVVHQVAVAIKY